MKWVIVGKRRITAELDGENKPYPPGYEGPMEDKWAIHFARAQALSVLGDVEDFDEDGNFVGQSDASEVENAETNEGQSDAEETAESGDTTGSDGDGVVSPGPRAGAGEEPAPKPKAKRRTRTRKPAAES